MESLTSLLTSVAFGASSLAAAYSNCTINGRSVPCNQFLDFAGGFIASFVGFFLLLLLAGLIFWIWMLVDAVKRDFEHKPLWILIILLTGVIGAIVYLFAVKRKYKNASTTVSGSPQNP